MKIKHEAQIELSGNTTIGELMTALTNADVPETAKVRISQYPGNQRESGYTTVTFTWEQ